MNIYPAQIKDPSKITVEEIMNIVLIDDSHLVRERVANIISELPSINVIGEAGNSIEAMEIIEMMNPDVAILDIKMPGISGVEMLQELKIKHPGMKIIMLTNYPFAQYKAKCLEYGADYFLNKSDEFEKIPNILIEIGKQKYK